MVTSIQNGRCHIALRCRRLFKRADVTDGAVTSRVAGGTTGPANTASAQSRQFGTLMCAKQENASVGLRAESRMKRYARSVAAIALAFSACVSLDTTPVTTVRIVC
jgi:hypothetical protein